MGEYEILGRNRLFSLRRKGCKLGLLKFIFEVVGVSCREIDGFDIAMLAASFRVLGPLHLTIFEIQGVSPN